jgi:ribosomal 50S subunit-recycling heat shock protein
LKMSDVGDCYINNALAKPENEIRDRDTIELNQHI